MNNKLISIIIPTHNSATYICQTLDSILNQTYKNFEIIVIDDGSTDDTEEVLKNYIDTRKIIYLKKDNSGPASARNLGIKNAKGDLTAFCDADDMWLSEKLEKQIKLHEKYNDPIVSFSKRFFLKDGCDLEEAKEKLFSGNIYGKLLKSNFISNSSILIDRRIINDIGIFDEDFKNIIEDYDYYLRCANKYNFYFVDEYLLKYRIHIHQLSKRENRFKTTKTLLKQLNKNSSFVNFILNFYYTIKMFFYELRN